MNPRRAAVTALLRVQEEGGYSNILLDELLESAAMSVADRALATRLLYGVTERRLTLDYLLNQTSSTPVKKMTPTVREILRVGAYQLVYMDKTPAFAAINESVELTRAMGQGRLTGFVNGVLRQVERGHDKLLSDLPNTDKGMELRYSCPRAWIRLWRQAYGEDIMQGLLSSLQETPPAYIRVNTRRTTSAQLIERLAAEGVQATPVAGLPNALLVYPASALRRLPEDIQSHFYFQDLASQWACHALEAKAGERIADVCAAPGGKTMTVAQDVGDSGHILAGDIHDHKCRGLIERVKQYGFTAIEVMQKDASTPYDEMLQG
ncbi:MAG: 16S rRNA (cytosine(967)-C(5))-methyltransferase RsmB, partial [Clostridia bacterium]|nr:16S rRNA (cytosine(967)-C(5))-methyltransferase RsmB [Clostridia bacterium]